jgi:uncharacterized protein YfaS (alpha-2-macroglobulin family)
MSRKGIVRIDLPTPDGKQGVTIQNTGKGLLYARVVRTGTPMPGEERPFSEGMQLTVSYLTMEGKPLDPGSLDQGTDFMAVVNVYHDGLAGWYPNLALTQVFPSGWEIRNSRLEGTSEVGQNSYFTYQDIRDDRVMTYFNLEAGHTATYKVLLNAAYVGRFYLPATGCEAMYDHSVAARDKGRWVNVVKPGSTASTR